MDDVDGARKRPAPGSREPADETYGDRRYDCKDAEGHDWSFAQILAHVPPDQWGAQPA